MALACQAIEKALDDAGIERHEVDGLVTWDWENNTLWDVARNCGFKKVKYFGMAAHGGGSACGTVAHAVVAIATGMAKCVVVWRALNGRSGPRMAEGVPITAAAGEYQFKTPYGLGAAPAQAALRARRYMHVTGLTTRQLGAVAVTCRNHALTNPNALMYGKPITLDDHAQSRIIADPLRLLDCTLECDAAGAIIVTSAARARDLKQKPIYIMAAAQGLDNSGDIMSNYTNDMISFPDCEIVAKQIYPMAGVSPKDIDVAQFYDAFSPLIPMQLETYGFCKVGEGGPFCENGNIGLGGTLPVNTSGGNLSEGYIHGITHIIEGVRQMRGTSLAQVPNAELCLVTAGPVVPTSGLILRR
jgi:acetyl-CoA acetyltransferase